MNAQLIHGRHALLLFPLVPVALGAGREEPRSHDLCIRTLVLCTVFVAAQVWWVWSLLRRLPPMDVPP